jgi:hypothetical protein
MCLLPSLIVWELGFCLFLFRSIWHFNYFLPKFKIDMTWSFT